MAKTESRSNDAKRSVFHATLPPCPMSRFDCTITRIRKERIAVRQPEGNIVLDNGVKGQPVRVVEDGDVRLVAEVSFQHGGRHLPAVQAAQARRGA